MSCFQIFTSNFPFAYFALLNCAELYYCLLSNLIILVVLLTLLLLHLVCCFHVCVMYLIILEGLI